MKKDNRGFSLIELIIIIAIMAILIGVMAANVGRISGYRAKECRTKVISSLENGRMMTLSKARGNNSYVSATDTDTYLVFFYYRKNNSNYCLTVVNNAVTDVKKISKGRVTLKYSITKSETDDGAAVPEFGDSDDPKELSIATDASFLEQARDAGFKMAYNRQNGAFLPLDAAKTQYIYQMYAQLGNYNYGINIHPKTGKVEVGGRTKVPTTTP